MYAMWGVTTNEVLDASQYMFTWLEQLDNTEKDMQMHVLINTYWEQARVWPEQQPWLVNIPYAYH